MGNVDGSALTSHGPRACLVLGEIRIGIPVYWVFGRPGPHTMPCLPWQFAQLPMTSP